MHVRPSKATLQPVQAPLVVRSIRAGSRDARWLTTRLTRTTWQEEYMDTKQAGAAAKQLQPGYYEVADRRATLHISFRRVQAAVGARRPLARHARAVR